MTNYGRGRSKAGKIHIISKGARTPWCGVDGACEGVEPTRENADLVVTCKRCLAVFTGHAPARMEAKPS